MATHYYQLEVRMFAAGQFCEIAPIYQIDDPTEPDDYVLAGQLVAALDDGGPGVSWISKLCDCMSEECFVSTIRARRLAPTGGNTAVSLQQPTDFPGNVSFPLNTQQIAMCMVWVNGDATVRTSRSFIPATPESFLDSSRWTNDAIDAATAFVAKHIVGFSVAGGIFFPSIFDHVAKTGFRVLDGYLSRIVGTQRRRERSL